MTVVPFTGDRMARTADGTPYERRLDPATVYTLRDADGEPLYIGVSNNAVGRIAAHQRQAWWLEVKTIELLHFEERRDALDHERDLISRLAPKHNRQHAPETFAPADLGLNGAA